MSNLNDFIIEDGVLTQYKGDDKEIVIPDGVKIIGEGAFACKKQITKVIIPDSVKHIDVTAFWACHRLTDISMGKGVETIGKQAFAICTSLTEVIIGESVKHIEANAFYECKNLQIVKIPESVTQIDSGVFDLCESLTNIEVDDKNQYYSSINGNLYNKNKTTLIRYALGKKDTVFILPNSVRELEESVFSNVEVRKESMCSVLTEYFLMKSIKNTL